MHSRDYDSVIAGHYRKEALLHGLSPTCTMEDRAIREKETSAIVRFVDQSLRVRRSMGVGGPATIMDVGCGNGYTMHVLTSHFRDATLIGFEQTPELLELARSRFEGADNISVMEADIRIDEFSAGVQADVLISQRVLINIMDVDDQVLALRNVVRAMKPPAEGILGGRALFIESFATPLDNLNRARGELDLPPLKPAYHNLYLKDGFFETADLKPIEWDRDEFAPNFLSTHYFIARVIHPLLKSDRSISRNSELVNFFVGALNRNIGDYSPLKAYAYERIQTSCD